MKPWFKHVQHVMFPIKNGNGFGLLIHHVLSNSYINQIIAYIFPLCPHYIFPHYIPIFVDENHQTPTWGHTKEPLVTATIVAWPAWLMGGETTEGYKHSYFVSPFGGHRLLN